MRPRLFGMPAVRRRRVRPLFAAAVACTLAFGAVPAGAADLNPSYSVESVLGTTSQDPNSDEGRFVTLWDARFRSGPAFQAYLDSDEQYDDGYNDRRPEEQARLVRALVRHWHDTDSAFRDSVDWEPREPVAEGEPPQEVDPRERPHVEQILSLVNAIIFDKEKFKAALREDAPGGNETPSSTPEAPQPGTPADVLAGDAATELAGVVARAQELLDLDPLLRQPDQVLAPVDSQLRDAVSPDVLDRVPASADIAGADLGELGEQLQRVVPEIPEVERPPTEDVVVPARLSAAAFEADDLLYGVCWAVGTGAETCTADTYVVGVLTQLPGQAAGINVDNRLDTGLLGVDLEIGLVIDPLGTPGGLGATVTVKRYGTAAENAKGVIRYGLPASDLDVYVGFDGRDGVQVPVRKLQTQQSAAVVFENVAAMSVDDMRVKATVSHLGTPGVPTVALVTDVRGTVSPNRLAATTSFVRAPAAHTARLVLKRAGSTSLVRVESGHNGPGSPDVHVAAAARLGTTTITGSVLMDGVPATTTVTAVSDEATRTTTVTYEASAQLTRLQAGVVVTPDVAAPGNRLTAALDLHRLPRDITMVFNDSRVKYDASAGISAATGWALQASVEELVSGNVRRRAYVALTSAPSRVEVSRTAGSPLFVLDAGAGIAKIQAGYYDTSLSLDGVLTVEGFPGHVELRMPSSADPKVAWTSSAPTGKVDATVRYGAWRGGVTITSVPTSITFAPRTNEIDVNATGGTPAAVTAYITNTGTYAVSPSPQPGDNYVTATYRRTATPWGSSGSWNNAEVTAALHVQGIRRIRVTPGASTTFELRAGGGAPLYVLGRFEDGFSRKYAHARLANFPGVVTGTIGSTTEISASANSELRAYVESGPLLTHPAMTAPHGLIFRRAGSVNRGAIWLTGLPTYARFAPGQVNLNGLRPTQPTLEMDVRLDGATPVDARAALTGIPVNVSHDVAFTWSTQQAGSVVTTSANASTSGATFGALSASLFYGQYGASLATTALPSSMGVTITESEGTTRVDWNASAVLTEVRADLVARPTASSQFSGRGSVKLNNVPTWLSLTAGRGAAGTGPVMTYDSNSSASLSATVIADGQLRSSNASLGANLFFRLTNLARTVSVTPLGSGFRLTSSGRTTRIEALVSARASFTKTGNGTVPLRSWVRMPWEYSVTLSPVVKNLSVDLADVATFEVEPGLVSRLAGDYGTFRIAYDQFLVNLDARGKARLEFRLAGSWYGFDVWNASFSTAFNINPTMRVYEDATAQLFDRSFTAACYRVRTVATIRPRAITTTNLTNGVNTVGAPGQWRTHWVTPVVFGWNWLSDIVTGLTVHGSGFVSVWVDDDWICW